MVMGAYLGQYGNTPGLRSCSSDALIDALVSTTSLASRCRQGWEGRGGEGRGEEGRRGSGDISVLYSTM